MNFLKETLYARVMDENDIVTAAKAAFAILRARLPGMFGADEEALFRIGFLEGVNHACEILKEARHGPAVVADRRAMGD